jgi:hypothetical protein
MKDVGLSSFPLLGLEFCPAKPGMFCFLRRVILYSMETYSSQIHPILGGAMLDTPQNDIVVVAEVSGEMQAEMLRGLLEAQGITAMLSEESAARAIGINMPGMGLVQILVRAEQAEVAIQILQEYDSGELEDESFSEEDSFSADTDEAE